MLYYISCVLCVSVCLSVTLEHDYCMLDGDKCDQQAGVYRQIGLTSYEDWNIRDKLDEDLEFIKIRPRVALKKIEKTLRTFQHR